MYWNIQSNYTAHTIEGIYAPPLAICGILFKVCIIRLGLVLFNEGRSGFSGFNINQANQRAWFALIDALNDNAVIIVPPAP